MDNYHEPLELLSEEAINYHRIIRSIVEELEAVDWYNQRAEATDNPVVRRIVEHNRDEEIEHAVIALEWLRRNHPKWNEMLEKFLFTEGDLMNKHAVMQLGLEKMAHPYHEIDTTDYKDYGRNAEELEKWKNKSEEGISSRMDSKLKSWKKNVKPLWKDRQKKIQQDEKARKYESLIEQAEGDRKQKLVNKYRNYLEDNHPGPTKTDPKVRAFSRKLRSAKRKKHPTDKLTSEGKGQHTANTAAKGMGLGGIAGGIAGGLGTAAYARKGLNNSILKSLGKGAVGAIGGSALGAGTGATLGAASAPIARMMGKPKNKQKYNREGAINKWDNKLGNRKEYLYHGPR